jgi:hypothetical protein
MIKTDGKSTIAWADRHDERAWPHQPGSLDTCPTCAKTHAVPLDPPKPVKPDVVLENGDQLFFKTEKDYLDYITGQSKANA